MKKNIALVGGGYSEEAKISLLSCENLMSYLPHEEYNIFWVVLENQNSWVVKQKDKSIPVDIPIERGDFSFSLNGEKLYFHGAFIFIHGTPGEDGKLQNYFDLLGIPHLGSSAVSSMICFNKRMAKLIAAEVGIVSAKSFFYTPTSSESFIRQSAKNMFFPFIIKPNEGGSSVGLSLVENEDELVHQLQRISHEDMLVEEYIKGREFSVGVFKDKNELIVLPITEIISHNKLFDYEAKYHGKSDEITPAKIDEHLKQRIEEDAKRVYTQCACSAFVRMEFIWSEKHSQLYFLEVNTIPGFTQKSILPQQLAAAGLNIHQIFVHLFKEFFG